MGRSVSSVGRRWRWPPLGEGVVVVALAWQDSPLHGTGAVVVGFAAPATASMSSAGTSPSALTPHGPRPDDPAPRYADGRDGYADPSATSGTPISFSTGAVWSDLASKK